MDEYDKKFAEMQKYIPFLEAMIERLQNVKDKSREIQLQKMQSLHGILSNSKRKLKIETLQRCEDVLQKLHNKVEKGNTPGLQLPHKKGEGNVARLTTATDETSADQSTSAVKSENTEKMIEEKEMDETPASPSPPVSPDSVSQTAPIIIPTERSDFDDKPDSKPASPDQVETVPTKAPIIIPTERTGNPITLSPTTKHNPCKNEDFSEWDMLEQYEKQTKGKIGKPAGTSLLQKPNEGRPHSSTTPTRHGLPGSATPDGSRRTSLGLDKGRTAAGIEINTKDTLEAGVCTSDVKLKSPDSEALYSKHKAGSSPRVKDGHGKAGGKPGSASLLLSPPPVSTEPPLSMEDLAELLNEEDDVKSERKKSDARKDMSKTETGVGKDVKTSKPFLLTQDDIDRENERRWEEVDKHIVKLTTRKCLPSIPGTGTKPDTVKSNEIKGPPVQQCTGTSLDNRNPPQSPSTKTGPRYADNYERHPRQSRDSHAYDNVKDKSNPNMHPRLAEDELASPISVHLSGGNKQEDRAGAPLYSRRQGNIRPDIPPSKQDPEFRMEGSDYFNRQMQNSGHWQPMHGSMKPNEFHNNPWPPPPPANFSGIGNPPVPPQVPYNQHPIHKEMWSMPGPGNPIHMDSHPINADDPRPMRPNQFHPNMASGIMPLMSPTGRPQDINLPPRPDNIRDDLPNVNMPAIQPLRSPTSFGPVGSQYRNFQGENRPYEQPPFERGMEYPHVRQSWDSQSGRNADGGPYRGEGEVPCGIIGSEGPAGSAGSYPRPSTPCPWNRDRDRCSRGRARETYYNDRNRNESRSNFNSRDSRRSDWPREGHSEWDNNCNRFGRDNRSISERDPRVRGEHNVSNQNSSQSRDSSSASARDPRLAKDKHMNPTKSKECPVYNERDPRKRTPFQPLPSRKTKELPKSPKSSETHRRTDGEGSNKHSQEKTAKDKLQSPLESLYGVIDTKTKSGQGCLQNFKIPKIKRPESSQTFSPNHAEQARTSEKEDRPVEKTPEAKVNKNDADKDDAMAEVSSSSDGHALQPNWTGEDVVPDKKEDTKEEDSLPGSTQNLDKPDVKVGEADTATDGSPKSSSMIEKLEKDETEGEATKSKDEVTQEWIEALIKSFEVGEGKKLVEQAKLIQKLGEALQAKKLKKIKRIIDSESESSNSSKEESVESKKLKTKKKRRVIVSDSSDEECLAERLGILSTAINKETKEESQQEQRSSTEDKCEIKKEIEDSSAVSKTEEQPKPGEAEQRPSVADDNSAVANVEAGEVKTTEEKSCVGETEPEDASETKSSDALKSDADDSPLRAPKAKSKRRNSLEMLQEDIREMFICDGVVAATGHRMCRVQKEANIPATPSQSGSPVAKKEEPPAKVDAPPSEPEESAMTSKQKKLLRPRSVEEPNKGKAKPKTEPQRVTRQRVKRIVQSSDSEEDQPLALRTEIHNSSVVSNENETQSEEQTETLRRSKRFALPKDAKEPRVVVEKTELTKLDCSKVMFDSSSDESFGIDVSELAAAVDISLHPEKQSEQDAPETNEARKRGRQRGRRATRKRGKNSNNDADKADDAASFTDDGSITSDISMSSSVASGKKIAAPRMDGANEELLSNILVGLVPAKVDMEKSTDKGSDADVDDDASDQLPPEPGNKKSTVRKKKKKCNWQMGIVSKRKRKKTSVPKVDSDPLNVTTETDTSARMDSAPVEEKSPDASSKDNEASEKTASSAVDKKPDGTEANVKEESDHGTYNDNVDEKSSSSGAPVPAAPTKDLIKSEPEPSEEPSVKEKGQTDETQSDQRNDEKQSGIEGSTSEKPDEVEKATQEQPKESAAENSGKPENKKAEYDELIEKAFESLNIKQLVDYAWSKHEKYKCLLCFFTGKNIVHHYKISHPGKEILISRLTTTDAQAAIQEAKDAENGTKPAKAKENSRFSCRFCYFSTEGTEQTAMEAFYEHCTTHTGEYRFRCNSCAYQAVAKSSMRTHYYKVCRKYGDTFNDVITEDDIPNENSIYGYICSSCNYVQLKQGNLESHLSLWHSDSPSTRIVKINMSVDITEDESTTLPPRGRFKAEPEDDVEKTQESPVDTSQNEEVSDIKKSKDEAKEVEQVKAEPITFEEKETPPGSKSQKDEEKSVSSSSEPDSALPSGKLSVFLCPPELEHKEVQIQLERKKKMQEIIEDIGIKLNKGVSQKGLSITDKLKDKMKTNLQEANKEAKEVDLDDDSSNNKGSTLEPKDSSENPGKAGGTSRPDVVTIESPEEDPLACTETIPLTDEYDDNSASVQEEKSKAGNEAESGQADKSDSKVRDPLATMNEKKSYESEMDTSDNENTGDSAPIYDSDSSTEQSDTEPPTDVTTLLKETSNINASSKDSMMTTIQRLAAQLKASKDLEPGKGETPPPDKPKNSPVHQIPKPPNVVPITSAKQLVGKFSTKIKEALEHQEDPGQKNFIRPRRLSGDTLSITEEPTPVQSTPKSAYTDGNRSNTSDKIEPILHTDTEEECSFLKIENVVSLAPRSEKDGAESPIINDIRKAVETPVKSKPGVSLLKKSNAPLILKRINSVTITPPITKNIPIQPAPSDTVQIIPVKNVTATSTSVSKNPVTTAFVPITPKSKIIQLDTNNLTFPFTVNSTVISPVITKTMSVAPPGAQTNVNYKILKLPTALKPKEPAPQANASKYKSADAYKAMLDPVKLSQLYKCMSRSCHFTTDVIGIFHQHYLQHATEEKKQASPQNDYQRCAYCCANFDDWNQFKRHMDEKHAHCRYQCTYCFYRAVVPSYVQIHQTLLHTGVRGILLGKMLKDVPLKEEVNRHEVVHPYICQHGCGKFFYVSEVFAAHLKSKHSSTVQVLRCHLCRATVSKADQLLAHYKMHGLYKYQCLYCFNGSDMFNDMHNHLSSHHCNRLPQVLERSLPAKPTRNKDVIEQLVIRTLDSTIKTPDIIEIDNSGKVSKNPVRSGADTTNPPTFKLITKEITVIDKDENQVADKTVRNFISVADLGKGPGTSLTGPDDKAKKSSNISITSDIILAAPSTNKPSLESNAENSSKSLSFLFSEKSGTDKDLKASEKSIFRESRLDLTSYTSNDANAMDPLDSSGLDCTDEFININILDNPHFLKSVNSRSNDASFLNNTVSMSGNKTEDSDIEILENIEPTVPKPKKNESQFNIGKKEGTSEKSQTQPPTQSTEEKRETKSVCDSLDVSNDYSNSCNTSTVPDKPLTLEDIKDTGFTGTKLYRCGFESCTHGAQTAALLRSHAKECAYRGDNNALNCAHCGKRFVKIGFLLEHLKVHGLKRFGCSLCKMRCTVACQAMTHMKAKHKFANSKLVPADPKNPSADGLFVVQPVHPSGERRGKKRKSGKGTEKEAEKVADMEKLSFSPDEIESLPRQAIYNREVQCAMCPYTTKVRTNIIRHLQLHAKDESVPESGPVNPVPCLDKKERMFDKMVNLASSSHQNGRMGGKPKEASKDNEEEFIPKFVPEHKRYVCGVAECNYLTVDEAMLRYHLKALHSEEPYFRCPHCPSPPPGQEGMNIAIDKMGVHLKMHDTRLYKCSHCNHHHYHRHVVERHLTDKHPEKRPFVKVIRELESTENSQQPAQEEAEEEVPDPDGNHWKCNICDYKCVYKAEMISHASTTHDEKSQFKCTLCTFKSSGKIMFEQHINSKHSNDPNVDYVMVYQRIKGVNKRNVDNVEQNSQDEPFDTTPLWRRDMPRIRHIRGILLEEEDEAPVAETSAKSGKRKSETELVSTKPAKIKPGKSASLDENKQSKEKSKRSLSCEKIDSSDAPESSEKKTEKAVPEKSKESKAEKNRSVDPDDADGGRFGPYGKPDGNMYVCTLCTQFKSKYKHDMRDHLYRELNYARWHCKECGYLSVNRNALLRHLNKNHPGDNPDHEPLSPDDTIEDWVRTLLKKQTCMMRGIPYKPDTPTKTVVSTVESRSTPKKTSQTSSGKTVTTVDLTRSGPDFDTEIDDDSGDNETLIIDVGDDTPSGRGEKDADASDHERGATSTSAERGKPLTCKHCKMIFTRWRGFKLHVQLTHLKRLGYLCPYCDRSTNSETLMRQHIRSKHRGCAEKIIHNPDAGGPELTSDFWEKEYGIIIPKRLPKKRKRASAEGEKDDLSDVQEKCGVCGFTAINFTGLKSHMRIHAVKNHLECNYCTFSTSVKAELHEHWEINHPHMPFKYEDLSVEKPTSSQNKYDMDDFSDDIEEEHVVAGCDDNTDLWYCCFYCTYRSKSLDIVRTHWTFTHKEGKVGEQNSPFKYKELNIPVVPPPKIAKKSPPPPGKEDPPRESQKKQSQTESQATASQDGWICQWCNELCDSEGKMKSHHNMFHSHLPLNFRKEGSNEAPKGYGCPECKFTTTLINVMKSHVAKHINLFKCKYCDKTFDTPTNVSSHNTAEHPEQELKIESITNYEALVEKLMARVKWQKTGGDSQEDPVVIEASPRNAVAKKSTTKSAVRLQSIPLKIRAVARKSTNPLPRYPPNFSFKTSEADRSPEKSAPSEQFSYYGLPKAPVNLAKLNTYMVVGGHRMKVNCTTLAQLININPQIILNDIKNDTKNAAVLAKPK